MGVPPATISVPGGRQGPLPLHADDALPRGTAMLHARHHLLADEAALLEVDAVQLIEHRLMREGVAESVVAAALGHAKRDAARVILILAGERAAEIGDIGVGGKQDAEPELRQPRIGKSDGALRQERGVDPHDAATLSDGSSANATWVRSL